MKLGASSGQDGSGKALKPLNERDEPELSMATCLLLTIQNLNEIAFAYGESKAQAVFEAVGREIVSLERRHGTSVLVDHMDGGVWAFWPRTDQSHDAFDDLIGVGFMDLMLRPLVINGECIVPVVEVQRGPRFLEKPVASMSDQPSRFASLLVPTIGFVWQFPEDAETYQATMRSAVALIADLEMGNLVWGARVVMPGVDGSPPLYHSCRRYRINSDGEYEALDSQISSLIRLGLIRAYDVLSLNWALLRLRNDPDLRLGILISGQSLRPGVWWDQLIETLRTEPGLGERLFIEIGTQGPLPNIAHAVNICERLKSHGVGIVIEGDEQSNIGLSDIMAIKPKLIALPSMFMRLSFNKQSWLSSANMLNLFFKTIAENTIIDELMDEDGFKYLDGGAPSLIRRQQVSSIRHFTAPYFANSRSDDAKGAR